VNIGSLLQNAALRYGRQTAIAADGRTLTFAQLEARCGQLSGAFLQAGLRPGDRVAVLSFNGPEMVETYFAALRVGLAAVPVNYRLVGEEIAFILNDAGARALVYGADFEEAVEGIRHRLESVEIFVRFGGRRRGPAQDYEAFLSAGKSVPFDPSLDEAHPCQVMYTSGTTGRPKGAVITHANVLWNLFNTIHGREDGTGQRSIIVGPLYHTAALNNHLTIQISLGGTSILVKQFEPEALLRLVEKERATTISGSPAMYNLLMQNGAGHRFDTRSITKCTAGADKLPMETKRRLMEFFPNIGGVYDVYGCTEASPCITILRAADSLRKDGSVGPPLPFLTARVVDEQGGPLAPGEVGEVVCRGPNVMAGYHNDPEGTREALRDGWLHTGDLARTDEEGFFYIVDRKKDMIVSGGENIYPREIEEVLYTHPAVADAAVVGMPDETWGESVRAFIQLCPDARLTAEEVIAYCRRHLAGYKKPRRVDFIDEIPRNPSGKALKRRLQRIE
jgi:acyl-CoA synthetase (AMP-forming)/AMP-acid ligase II